MSSFWNFVFAIILIILWIVAGGFVTQANTKLGSYKDKDGHMGLAYWTTFTAAFITWTLIGLFVLGIGYVVVAGVFFAPEEAAVGGSAAVAGEGAAVAGEGAALAGEAAAEGEAIASETEKAVEETGKEAKKAERSAVKKEEELMKNQKGGKKGKNPTKKKKEGFLHRWIDRFVLLFLGIALVLTFTTGILAAIAANAMVQSSYYSADNSKLATARKDCIIGASLCLGAAGLLIVGFIVILILKERGRYKAKKEIERQEKEAAATAAQRAQEKEKADEAAAAQRKLAAEKVEEFKRLSLEKKAAKQSQINDQNEALAQQLRTAKANILEQKMYQQAGLAPPPAGIALPPAVPPSVPANLPPAVPPAVPRAPPPLLPPKLPPPLPPAVPANLPAVPAPRA